MPNRIQWIGVSGQGFFLMLGKFPYHAATVAVFLLTGCHSDLGEPLQSGRVLPLIGLEGRWIGPVASADANCGKPRTGVLTIGPQEFVFDPFQSTIIIRGKPGPGQKIAGTLTQQGGDHQTLSISFDAMQKQDAAGKDTIAGSLVSGRCTWSVTLARG